MSFKYDFLGVGGLAYDLVLRVDCLPIADEKYPARLIGKLPGGSIANATCAAARLGLQAGYIGWVGNDADGVALHAELVEWGVDPAGLVRVQGEETPFTVVVTDAHGQHAILLPASPLYEASFTPEQYGLVGEARAVYTFPRDRAWFGHLRGRTLESGGLLALDIDTAVSMQGAELRQAIRLADMVFFRPGSPSLVGVQSLRELVEPGQWMIMTEGSRGAHGIAGGMGTPVYQPALPVEVIDTTGAGDCFRAALIAARLDGAALVEALRFAAAAAALKVQYYGGRGGLPSRDDIAEMLNTLPPEPPT
jgi:ribokinase/sulfofructose kinase